jgi:hypothetical protein
LVQTRLTPIPTWYANRLFRSRLEARWAVFFDQLGISWEYEPQGYLVDGRPYLPDFLLDGKTWAEVKGAEAELDIGMLGRFVCADRRDLLILGPIPQPDPQGEWCWTRLAAHFAGTIAPDASGAERVVSTEYEWAEDLVSFHRWLDKHRPWHHDVSGWTQSTRTQPFLDTDYAPSASGAYRAACAARFEHGEHGAPR